MKVKDEISSNVHLSEIGHGSTEVKFALFNKKKQTVITPFCKCKDFFNDLFWSNKVNKDISIYGFNWKPNQDEGILNEDKISIVVKIVSSNGGDVKDMQKEDLKKLITLVNKIARANKFKLSRGFISEDGKNAIISVDKKWTETPYVNSFLFLILRLGFRYEGGTIKECYSKVGNFICVGDQMHVKNGEKLIEDLENGIIHSDQKYEDYEEGYSVHGSSGLLGYSSKLKSINKI